MNILLYGVPAEIADRIAGRYSLKLTSTLVAPGEQAGLQLIPPMSSPRQLLAFYNAMLVRESEIDAVIVCDTVSCDAVSTVQYCSPQGKFFTVSGAGRRRGVGVRHFPDRGDQTGSVSAPTRVSDSGARSFPENSGPSSTKNALREQSRSAFFSAAARLTRQICQPHCPVDTSPG